jgi:hypothetical protein
MVASVAGTGADFEPCPTLDARLLLGSPSFTSGPSWPTDGASGNLKKELGPSSRGARDVRAERTPIRRGAAPVSHRAITPRTQAVRPARQPRQDAGTSRAEPGFLLLRSSAIDGVLRWRISLVASTARGVTPDRF